MLIQHFQHLHYLFYVQSYCVTSFIADGILQKFEECIASIENHFFWQFNLKQSFQWNKLTCLPFQTVIKLNLIKFIRERNLGRCQLYMGWGQIAVYANLSVQFISLLKVRCILCSNPWDSLVFNRIHHNFLWHCHGWISKRTAFARYEKNERKKLWKGKSMISAATKLFFSFFTKALIKRNSPRAIVTSRMPFCYDCNVYKLKMFWKYMNKFLFYTFRPKFHQTNI